MKYKPENKGKLTPQSAIDLLHLSKLFKTSKQAGLPPGTLLHVGEQKMEHAVISLIDYDVDTITESVIESPEECLPFRDSSTVTWINIDGLHDVDLIDRIGKLFDIHSLVLEDILNTGQRPKVEDHDNYLFMILKKIRYDLETETVKEDQISIITGKNYIITFQEKPGKIFQPVIDRIKNKRLKIRKKNTDYLTYALLDTVVDNGFTILGSLGERLEALDNILLENVTQQHIQAVFELKKKIFAVRKSVWPLREVTAAFLKGEFELIDESVLIYFRDVNDHVLQIIEAIDSYREIVSSMIDTYLSSLSLKMNEVMKVLTIAAAIFMPLTFIAGIYGMNFKYMPELESKWGYFFVLGVMTGLGALMLWLFRRKKWL